MFFVAENVSGLSSVNKKSDFERILEALRRAGKGYYVVPHLYKFEEYGVPQRRHRYIIVGFRADTGIRFVHPDPRGYQIKTAKEALSELPDGVVNNERPYRVSGSERSYIKPAKTYYCGLPDDLKLK